jgi:hypothetical protein
MATPLSRGSSPKRGDRLSFLLGIIRDAVLIWAITKSGGKIPAEWLF